jgi:hypothetical protein
VIAITHVDVPITFTTSPRRMPAPIASQWASMPPTGIGIPGRKPSRLAQGSQSLPATWSEVA